ncbi:MAG: 2-dehydropantoate 2-reductase N-terminal domain-containing protein, partial [Pseudomonadota bacterium]
MARKILILGASYGSLLGTKLAMAGHDVTLVCRTGTADLINAEGTEVRLKLKDETRHRHIRSRELPGRIDAATPSEVDPVAYDIGLAMQEPQYAHPAIRALMGKVAESAVPVMSIMNMPPLPFLARLPGVDTTMLRGAYRDARVWDAFEPARVTLASPDPQAFRPPEEPMNVLQVSLPTNFKVAAFDDPAHTALLRQLEADIDAVR